MERIRVNIIPKGITPVCHASQYDTGRVIRFDIMDDLQPFMLSGTETIEFRVCKPDGNIVTAAVENTSSSYVDIVTTQQMTACEGINKCTLNIVDENDYDIATINIDMKVQVDVLKDGIESDTEIHNLTEQVISIVSEQYDSDNVIFDNEPVEGHAAPYTVSSQGIKAALDSVAATIPDELNDLSDVNISSPSSNQALVWDADNNKWTNGEVSTVGNLDDLSDVDTSGKASGDSLRYDGNDWIAKPTTIEMTQAEYNTIVDFTPYANTHIVITDAPNLNATASDIEYSGGVTVADKLDSLKAVATSGDYSDLINKPLTFGGVLTDLNNVSRTTLSFTLYAFNGGATNSPSGSAGGWLLSMINDNTTNYGSQIASTNGGLFFRKLVGGTFQAWTTLAT